MNNHNSDKENNFFTKEAILVLVVSTIFAFIAGKLLDPLLSYLYSLLINWGGKVTDYISDSTYVQISNGFSEQSSMFSSYLLFLVSLLGIFSAMSLLKDRYTALFERYNQYETALNTIHTPNQIEQEKHNIPSDRIEQHDLNKIEYELKVSIKSQRWKYKIYYALGCISIVLLMTLLTYMYARNAYVNKKITVLTNNIEIVSPYISDLEYKQLKSDFHSMNSSTDYDRLVSRLSTISNNYSLSLKK